MNICSHFVTVFWLIVFYLLWQKLIQDYGNPILPHTTASYLHPQTVPRSKRAAAAAGNTTHEIPVKVTSQKR